MKKNNLPSRPKTLKEWFYDLIPIFLLILFLCSFPRVIAFISGLIKYLNTL